jgi:hypothetical protein
MPPWSLEAPSRLFAICFTFAASIYNPGAYSASTSAPSFFLFSLAKFSSASEGRGINASLGFPRQRIFARTFLRYYRATLYIARQLASFGPHYKAALSDTLKVRGLPAILRHFVQTRFSFPSLLTFLYSSAVTHRHRHRHRHYHYHCCCCRCCCYPYRYCCYIGTIDPAKAEVKRGSGQW